MAFVYKYPRPTCSADIVVLRPDNHVLLIARKHDPYKGRWALPGGFMEMDELLVKTAQRELLEETGINAALKSFERRGYYDGPKRDPRGRMITFAFVLRVPSKQKAAASDDAEKCEWFPLSGLPQLAFDHAKIIRDCCA